MTGCADVPRTRNAAATKNAILEAARQRFLEESYDNVGLRDIARDVGVDVALVGRYFGSKEELFRQVLRGGKTRSFQTEIASADLPAYLADVLMDPAADNEANVARLIMILRSASSPCAAEIVRSALEDDVLEPVTRLLEGSHAHLRASLSLGVVMGATILRTIMAVGSFCTYDRELVRGKLIRIIAAALSDDTGAEAVPIITPFDCGSSRP